MLKPLLYKSYLQTIINSVGSNQYRNFYVYNNDHKVMTPLEDNIINNNITEINKDITEINKSPKAIDVLENGNLSCAIFVSNILHMFSGIMKLIDTPHVTIMSTVQDLERNGWYEVNELKAGAILKWESVDFGITGYHEHIGFYIGNNKAVSNDSKTLTMAKHSHDYNGERKIEKIYWHDGLDK